MDLGLQKALQAFLGRGNGCVFQADEGQYHNGGPVGVLTGPSNSRLAVRLRSGGFTSIQEFALLPSARTTRWIIPIGDSQRTASGLNIYMPYALGARALKLLLMAFNRMGWTGWARHKLLVASSQPLMIETLVSEVTGEARPVFALSLGTPDRFRKLTVQVMRSSGEILGYIKLPLAREGTERVRGEAKILQHLWGFDALQRHIPRVLYAGEWGDGYILFQSSRAHSPGPVKFGSLHGEFLKVLWSVHRTTRSGQDLVDEVRLEWRKAEPHLPPGWRELAERAFDRAIRDLVGETIACGLWHGDFAPWNTRSGNGPLFVFDWEYASTGVPNMWDFFHFHVQVNSHLHRRTRTDLPLARSAAERASFLLFVLNSVCRLIDEQVDRRNAIKYRQRLLLQELSRAEKESRIASCRQQPSFSYD